jgi:hypothetical protein
MVQSWMTLKIYQQIGTRRVNIGFSLRLSGIEFLEALIPPRL